MIRIREIKKFPKSMLKHLGPTATEQFEMSGDYAWAIINQSDRKWIVYGADKKPLLVAGVLRKTLLGYPELWFLMCKAFPENLRQNLRESVGLREKLLEYYPVVRAKVTAADTVGHKFARFFKFKELSTEQVQNKFITIYEATK